MKKNMLNNNQNNVRGFTLIELLAVIVVLAIVMLIAVNAVLPKVEEARKRSFSVEVNGLIKSAQQYVITDVATNGTVIPTISSLNPTGGKCYTVQQLVASGDSGLNASKYKGKVLVYKKNNQIFYQVSLTNNKYMVLAKGMTVTGTSSNPVPANVEVTINDVQDYVSSTAASNFTC